MKAEIEIKAAPEKVFAAWTQQEQFVKWFGPRADGHLEVDQFDCTKGGRYDVTMVFSDGDRVQLAGNFQELDPPKKIVFTWQWAPEGTAPSYETLVTVDLVPTDLGTHLTLTHERFASTEPRDQHNQGWAPILVKLASLFDN